LQEPGPTPTALTGLINQTIFSPRGAAAHHLLGPLDKLGIALIDLDSSKASTTPMATPSANNVVIAFAELAQQKSAR